MLVTIHNPNMSNQSVIGGGVFAPGITEKDLTEKQIKIIQNTGVLKVIPVRIKKSFIKVKKELSSGSLKLLNRENKNIKSYSKTKKSFIKK